jgi:membrane protease YdiL (CAAX protease family)
MAINIKKVALFVVLTYGLSYLLAIVYYLGGGTMKPPGILVLGFLYMFVPTTAAIVVQKLLYRAPLKEPLRINFRPNRWFLVAWVLPPLIAVATLGVALLFPGVTFSSDKGDFRNLLIEPKQLGLENGFWPGFLLGLLQGLVTGITVNALAGFGEELGWRGFLQRELGMLGFWKASAVIGLVWGFWHAPLIVRGLNYPQHPWAGVFLMTAETLLLAPLFGYIALKANSVVAAAILHGTFNGASVVATMGLEGGNDLLIGVTGLAGFVVLLVAGSAAQAVTQGPAESIPGSWGASPCSQKMMRP